MASGGRIGVSPAVKIARRIDLSSAVNQRRGIPHWSRRRSAGRIDLSISTTVSRGISTTIHCNKNRFSTNSHHDFSEIGYTDVADLLSTPERDYLLKPNGQKVPVSSLKGKLVGLYLCENIPQPPRMQAIKKVYEEAKSRGYDFEIVQITFDFHFNAEHFGTNPIGQQFCEDINWLTLAFTDPSFKKIQRIFECVDEEDGYWAGDSLVLIYPCQADDILFEFSGAEILEQWGIEGYPFSRPSLYKAEYELQKREVTLQWLFPPGKCFLRRPRSAGDGFDLVDAFSQLSGKRVLVWFAPHFNCADNDYFIRMLKSEYHAQLKDNVAEESKLEVVYVSTGFGVSSFDEFTKDMPWLVQPLTNQCYGNSKDCLFKIFKPYPMGAAAVAFNEQGELIAKEDDLNEQESGDKLRFPFIDQDLEKRIRMEVEALCDEAN